MSEVRSRRRIIGNIGDAIGDPAATVLFQYLINGVKRWEEGNGKNKNELNIQMQ